MSLASQSVLLEEGESHHRLVSVFVLIDALGWKYVEGRDFLSDILPFRQPLRTVLGFSSGAIPAMLTGVPPAENGHCNLFYYDPQGSPFRWSRHFLFLPNWLWEHRSMRNLFNSTHNPLLALPPSLAHILPPSSP